MAARLLPWAIRISRVESREALDRLMDLWWQAMMASGNAARWIGFEDHMQLRDWEGAKRSIVGIYGRSSTEHQSTVDTLSAAIHQSKVFGQRSPLDGGRPS